MTFDYIMDLQRDIKLIMKGPIAKKQKKISKGF